MRDQAANLRALMQDKIGENKVEADTNLRVLTITSGKGGVGKTSLAVNLAIALQNMGHRVIVIDGDFGLGNVDIMLGLTGKYNLSHVIFDDIDIYDVLMEGPAGIMILPGGSGLLDIADITDGQLETFLDQLRKLSSIADIMLIDTGAGISSKNIKMILAANESILVTTPDPTSLMDAYGIVKVASTIDDYVNFKLVMNMVEDVYDAKLAIKNFQKAGKQFLDVEINTLGIIERSPIISRSTRHQRAFILQDYQSNSTKQLRDVAVNLVGHGHLDINRGLGSYINRLFSFLKKK